MPRRSQTADHTDADTRGSISLDNALRVNRPQMGNSASLLLYRLVRLNLFEDILGRQGARPSYLAGKRLGLQLGPPDLPSFVQMFRDLGIGRIDIARRTQDELRIDLFECATCAGLTPVGRTLCSFEGGLIAGIVQSIVGRRVTAAEVTCIGGLGHDSCGFHLTVDPPDVPRAV